MPIQFSCPQCGKNFTVPDDQGGKKGKCSCGALMEIPIPQVASAMSDGMRDLLPMDGDSGANACGGCGSPLCDGAVICMACGFNTLTGKRLVTDPDGAPGQSGGAGRPVLVDEDEEPAQPPSPLQNVAQVGVGVVAFIVFAFIGYIIVTSFIEYV